MRWHYSIIFKAAPTTEIKQFCFSSIWTIYDTEAVALEKPC